MLKKFSSLEELQDILLDLMIHPDKKTTFDIHAALFLIIEEINALKKRSHIVIKPME